MKTLLFYEIAPDGMAKAMGHFPAHRARMQAFHEKGSLLMAGPYANPAEGALAALTTREATEEFAQGDPFVINDVVGRWTLREWNEVLA